MSGNSTGQVLGASTTAAGVAVLPSTGANPTLHLVTLFITSVGAVVAVSFMTSRLYRKLYR